MIAVAGPMVAAGEPDRAEHLVMSIGHPYKRDAALRSLIEAVTAAGDHDRAERLAELFEDPHQRARVWESLVARTDEPRATRLTAQLLQAVGWTRPLNAVARLQPNAFEKISAEFLRLLDHAGHRT